MVDIPNTESKPLDSATYTKSDGRSALAIGRVQLSEHAYQLVKDQKIKKGDVLTVAEVTGIFGAKQTSDLFPYCKPNVMSEINIEFGMSDSDHSITVQAFTKAGGPVGVEMEAMTAVSISCLAIYDMCKSTDQSITISDIHLVSKTGGQSGSFRSN